MKCPGLDVASVFFSKNGQKIHRNHKILILLKHFLKKFHQVAPNRIGRDYLCLFFLVAKFCNLAIFFSGNEKKKHKNYA
jgi:hypothetical protein